MTRLMISEWKLNFLAITWSNEISPFEAPAIQFQPNVMACVSISISRILPSLLLLKFKNMKTIS